MIPLLETIEESSRKMLDAMADIVWTINAENDEFEKIILRMRSFAYELLGAKNKDIEALTEIITRLQNHFYTEPFHPIQLTLPDLPHINHSK